jgi:Carboxypeptidase regulatory-like domain
VKRGLILVALLFPAGAVAQSVTGTIFGTVRDATGAAVAGTSVVLTGTSTGLSRSVATDQSGAYVAPLLATGDYTVRVQVAGFKTESVTGIVLGVDQKVRVDIDLTIGDVSETVVVGARNSLVQRSASDLSATRDSSEMQALPLNGRNFVQLTRTLPGVVRGVPGENIDGAGNIAWRGSASLSANGQRTRDNNFLLDGLDNNEVWLNTVAIYPSIEALDELKVQTGIYAAEFGRSLGGVVSLQTKSGGNTFHGGAFEFARDDALDANDWFNNRAGRPKPDFRHRQFGGTLGGPLIKNRTFFFGDYQGWRIKQDLTLVSTVPSEPMRRGDFSELTRVIYDPQTRAPFPGNAVPTGRIDPVSARIIDQLYPLPNTAGRRTENGQTIDNYVINPTQRRTDDQADVRIDHGFGDANRAFVRYSMQSANRVIPPALPNGDGGATAGTYDIDAQSIAFNDTHTFGLRWLNELRIGWSGIDLGFTRFGYGRNTAAELGIPGINVDERTSGMVSIVNTTADMRFVGSGGTGTANTSAFQVTDSVTHVRGRHTLKVGASWILRTRHIYFSDLPLGLFAHTPNVTSSCAGTITLCTADPDTGFSFASFVLGHPNNFSRSTIAAPYTERRPEWSAYLQDDVRLGQRLTFNLGLRWDLFVPYREDDDRQSNLDTSTGQFVVASDDARMNGVRVGRYLQTYAKTDFAPRLGFAYDVDGAGRTIVRGGFGVFWNTPLTGTASSKGQNSPFVLSQAVTNPLPFVPSLDYTSGSVPPTPVTGGNSRSSFDINFRDGYAQQWSVNVQRQVGATNMFELGYVGSRGRQLVVIVDVNQAPAQLGVTNSNVNRPFFRVNRMLGTVAQSQSKGTLDYHALQTRFVRRFARGFSATASYTYGKAIDLSSETDGFAAFPNAYDLGYNRGPASYDVTHVFTSTWIYMLPMGRDRVFGNWQISGLLLARSGYPFTVFQSQNPLSTVSFATPGQLYRPDRIGSGRVDSPTVDRWFDTSAFVATSEPTATFGNSGRNILRGPGQFTIDAALTKLTSVGAVETELRIEAFNLLNSPAFANPATTLGSANTATISSLMPSTPMRQIQLGLKVRF